MLAAGLGRSPRAWRSLSCARLRFLLHALRLLHQLADSSTHIIFHRFAARFRGRTESPRARAAELRAAGSARQDRRRSDSSAGLTDALSASVAARLRPALLRGSSPYAFEFHLDGLRADHGAQRCSIIATSGGELRSVHAPASARRRTTPPSIRDAGSNAARVARPVP